MPTTVTLTPELLSSLAGIALSLIFSYGPGIRDKWATLTTEQRSLGMLLMLLGISAGAFGASCSGLLPVVECNQAGVNRLIWTFMLTAIANQTAYKFSPQLKSAKALTPPPAATAESPFVQEPVVAPVVPPAPMVESHLG